ncbi:MAG: cytochrome c maturation protein CcmE [Alphaproteobacteria bacterium]|nr:MAG: cytochrome c maturation protein CcmE [Alphaproteobacteria bacterium]
MAGLKKRRRIQLIVVGLVLLFAATGVVIYAMTVTGAARYAYTPTEVVEDPPDARVFLRIGGLVEKGSMQRGEDESVRFSVTDTNRSVTVTFKGILPDLVKEGQGVVAMGHMKDGVLVATEILARHDETYMPKEAIDSLKAQGVYRKP